MSLKFKVIGGVEPTKISKHHRRTKIVATLGAASVPKIRELILAGVNCFRLDFNHITKPETQTAIIREIRAQSKALEYSVAIMGDLGGPKILCNDFQPESAITLAPHALVRLMYSTGSGTEGLITTSFAKIIPDLKIGHRVLLDDGALLLKVESTVSETEVLCRVVVGGILKSKKGIHIPELLVGISALTKKDKSDARYMFDLRLDYVALSFVQKPEDVEELLNLFKKWTEEEDVAEAERRKAEGDKHTFDGEQEFEVQKHEAVWRPLIIAKIETPHAVANIEPIIKVADGIMVARGDLGVECSLQQVPVLQKLLMRLANKAEKPCITATQMLESMIKTPSPTRAEVSDVANAVFDGTDAVMLSAETAEGNYPVETVQMMAQICMEAESGPKFMHPPPLVLGVNEGECKMKVKIRAEFGRAIADAAVSAANESHAAAIVVFTTSGDTAYRVSKRRLSIPIIAVTPHPSVARHLALLYAVTPMVLSNLGKISSNTALTSGDPTRPFVSYKSRPQSTDEIYAFTERHIAQRVASEARDAVSRGIEYGTYIPPIRLDMPIVFCSGYHSLWPGLCNTMKISRFGNAMRSQHSRTLWSQAIQLIDNHKQRCLNEEVPI